MKYVKMLGLLVMAAASLMAFASSASATITSPAGTAYTEEIHATLATPNSALLRAGIEDTCGESTVAGKVETNNTEHAKGKITKLTFGDCTKTTHVLTLGELTIAAGGTVTAFGTEVTVFDLGVTCVYGGGTGTDLGVLKGGTPAVLEVSTTKLQRISGNTFLCAKEGTWTGKYTVTTPNTLLVDET